MRELLNKIKGYLYGHKKEVLVVFSIVVVLISVTLTSVVRLGQARRLYADIGNELERTRDYYFRLEQELERERYNNRRLEEITTRERECVERLGELTESSVGTVQEAIGLIRKIREQIIQMESVWNNSDRSGGSNDNIYDCKKD